MRESLTSDPLGAIHTYDNSTPSGSLELAAFKTIERLSNLGILWSLPASAIGHIFFQ